MLISLQEYTAVVAALSFRPLLRRWLRSFAATSFSEVFHFEKIFWRPPSRPGVSVLSEGDSPCHVARVVSRARCRHILS